MQLDPLLPLPAKNCQVHELAERLAKAQFAARRNPDDCALLYCALGKKSVLQVGGCRWLGCEWKGNSSYFCGCFVSGGVVHPHKPLVATALCECQKKGPRSFVA